MPGDSLALSNMDILKEDTMNFERMAGPFPVPTVPARPGGGATGVPSSRITGVSVAIWKPLVSADLLVYLGCAAYLTGSERSIKRGWQLFSSERFAPVRK